MKVKIKNFQSIKDLDIVIEGFTTIVGKSNIGKSSIIRAIDGALTNRKGDNFVRKGEHHSEVHLECPEIDLLWKKGGGHNDYIIKDSDGVEESLENVGHGVPDHIASSGFRPVESNRSKFSVQVASQFNPIFLLDSNTTTGSEVAEIISDIGRLSEVQDAFSNCQKDRKNMKSEIRVREKDLAKAKEQLTHYDDLENDMRQVDEIKSQHKAIGQLKTKLESLTSLKGDNDEVTQVLDHLTGLDSVEVPIWEEDSLFKQILSFQRLQVQVKDQSEVLIKYKDLDSVDIPELSVDDILSQVRALSGFQSHVKSADTDIDHYKDLDIIRIPEFEDLSSLQDDYNSLREFKASYDHIESNIPSLESDIENITSNIETLSNDIHAILVEAGECPVCGEVVND